MTARTRNRIIVIGLAVLVAGLVAVFTLFDKGNAPEPAAPSSAPADEGLAPSAAVDVPAAPDGLEPEPATEPLIEGKTASLQMAELFAERYGSYSNQGNYQNLRDLLPVMTVSYRSETEDFLDSISAAPPAEIYEGYTSVKVASEERAFDDNAGTARYDISLQQVKVVGAGEPEVLYPVLRVSLKKIGENWKIAGSEWVR